MSSGQNPPTRAEQQEAFRVGVFSARRGLPVTACPWDPGDGGRNKALAYMFVRGYRSIIPAPETAPGGPAGTVEGGE